MAVEKQIALNGQQMEDVFLRQSKGQIVNYTTANKPTPAAFGTGPIWVDGVQYWSDGAGFSRVDRLINVKSFGAKGDGVTDDTTAINNALLAAKSLVSPVSNQPDGAIGYYSGGATVYIPAGVYLTSAEIVVPYNIYLTGDGSRSSVIQSSYDGRIISSEIGEAYGNKAGGISSIRVVGDRTLTNQTGISLLRPIFSSVYSDIEIGEVGGNGLEIFEGVGAKFNNILVQTCVGHGVLLDSGFPAWGGASNNLPTNAVSLIGCISNRNDGAGLKINNSNGNTVFGGFYQSNYFSSGSGVGNNIEVTGGSNSNLLTGVWLEGAVNAHLYVNTNGGNLTQNAVTYSNSHITVSPGNNRAVICKQGIAILENLTSQASAFPTINGSAAPFRCNKAGTTGRIVYRGSPHTGKGKNGKSIIEDENGNDFGLELYAHSTITDGQMSKEQGAKEYYMEDSPNYDAKYYSSNTTGWDTNPWLRFSPKDKALYIGDGVGNDITITTGTGTPEGVLVAGVGSLYTDKAGGAGTTLYIKEAGAGLNTGWVAK